MAPCTYVQPSLARCFSYTQLSYWRTVHVEVLSYQIYIIFWEGLSVWFFFRFSWIAPLYSHWSPWVHIHSLSEWNSLHHTLDEPDQPPYIACVRKWETLTLLHWLHFAKWAVLDYDLGVHKIAGVLCRVLTISGGSEGTSKMTDACELTNQAVLFTLWFWPSHFWILDLLFTSFSKPRNRPPLRLI